MNNFEIKPEIESEVNIVDYDNSWHNEQGI